MAIKPSELVFGRVNDGPAFTSGALHDVFTAGRVDGATDYVLVELRNTSALTLTGGKAWLTIDTGGAAIALAVADAATARPFGYRYDPEAAPSGLTYTTPTTQAAGFTLPTLTSGQKCLLALRRTLTGAAVAYPETNRLNVSGTSPL